MPSEGEKSEWTRGMRRAWESVEKKGGPVIPACQRDNFLVPVTGLLFFFSSCSVASWRVFASLLPTLSLTHKLSSPLSLSNTSPAPWLTGTPPLLPPLLGCNGIPSHPPGVRKALLRTNHPPPPPLGVSQALLLDLQPVRLLQSWVALLGMHLPRLLDLRLLRTPPLGEFQSLPHLLQIQVPLLGEHLAAKTRAAAATGVVRRNRCRTL